MGTFFTTILSALLLTACGYYLFSLYAAWRFFRTPGRQSETLPPVSIFKPLKGASPGLYDYLASFCRLDYPVFQLLCGIRDPHDPAVAVVRQLQRDFPHLDIRLVVNPEVIGSNYKVSTLHRLQREAKHDIFIVSDSDVLVTPATLKSVVSLLQQPTIGLVTCPYRGAAAASLPARLESLMINTSFTPQVLIASQIEKTTYAFGAFIAVKRRCVEAIGGFAALSDYLADDYYLGFLVTQAGYEARIIPQVVETHPDAATLRALFLHQLRWARTQRLCRPAGYFGTAITHGTLWASIGLLLPTTSSLLVSLSLVTLGVRLFTATLLTRRFLHSRVPLSMFLLVPLADLVSFVVWCTGIRGDIVQWGEYSFHIHRDGTMVRVATVATLEAERGYAASHNPSAPGRN